MLKKAGIIKRAGGRKVGYENVTPLPPQRRMPAYPAKFPDEAESPEGRELRNTRNTRNDEFTLQHAQLADGQRTKSVAEVRTKNEERRKVFQMKTLAVDVPEIAFATLRMDINEMTSEIRSAAIVKWYELGMLSQGRAAEILGITRASFIDLLSKYHVSPFQYTDEELQNEIR